MINNHIFISTYWF